MEELEEVNAALEVDQWGDIFRSEGGVTPVDDVPEVLGGNFGGRDVKGEDVIGELVEGEVFP